MSHRKIKWGVIGPGGIASRRTIPSGIIPARNAELVAVCGRENETTVSIGRRFNVPAFTSLEEMLRCDIEAVYVATPVHLHAEQVIACAKAGKHILCEKPLAIDMARSGEMKEACEQVGVSLGVMFMMRFAGQHQRAFEFISAGRLGKPVFARAQLSCWYPAMPGAWRQDPALGGGGALMDMGSHCLDLLEMFFGRIKTVSCICANQVHPYGVEDSALVSLKFENGALGVVDTFFCMPDETSRNRLELYGSDGCITAEGTLGQDDTGTMTACFSPEKAYDAQQVRLPGITLTVPRTPLNPYRATIEEFSEAIIEGRKPTNDVHIGMRCQRLLAACYESARTFRTVHI